MKKQDLNISKGGLRAKEAFFASGNKLIDAVHFWFLEIIATV